MHANTCKYLHIHTKWSDLLGHLVGRMVDSWLILESDGVLFLWSCEFQPHPVPHQQIPIEKTREGLETLGFPGHLAKSHGFFHIFLTGSFGMICGSCWCSLRIFVTPGRNSWEAAFFHPFPPFFPLVWWTYTNSTISGKVISVKNISTWVICILMAKPQISRRVSFKSFQWWERLNHTTSFKKKHLSSQTLCRVFFPFLLRRFAATSSKACDFLLVLCGSAGWETVGSAGLPQRIAARIGWWTQTIGREAMVSLAFQSLWCLWLWRWALWLWLVGHNGWWFQNVSIFPLFSTSYI